MYLLEDDNVLITDFLYGQFGSKTNTIIKKLSEKMGLIILVLLKLVWRQQVNYYLKNGKNS